MGRWLVCSVTLFGALPPDRRQSMNYIDRDTSELPQLMGRCIAGVLILVITYPALCHCENQNCRLIRYSNASVNLAL